MMNAPPGRLVTAARLHADETVLDEVDAADAVLGADRVERFEQLEGFHLLAVDGDRHAAFEPDGDFAGLVGASAGLFVSIQISSGAALAGSSSAPPSCEMCQILRSRL